MIIEWWAGIETRKYQRVSLLNILLRIKTKYTIKSCAKRNLDVLFS